MIKGAINLSEVYSTLQDVNFLDIVKAGSFDYIPLEMTASLLLKTRTTEFVICKTDVFVHALGNRLVIASEMMCQSEHEWKREKDIELLAKQKGLDLLFLSNPKDKETVCVTHKTFTPDIGNFLCAIFPRLCPWHFEDNPLSKSELEYLLLFEKKEQDIRDWWNNYINAPGFNAKIVEKFAHAMSDTFNTNALRGAEQTVLDFTRAREKAEEEYLRACENLRNAQLLLTAYMNNAQDRSDEYAEYIKSCKSIIRMKRVENNFQFTIQTTMLNVDEDLITEYLENKNSYIYSNKKSFTDESIKLLVNSLFGHKRVLKLRVYATYELDPEGARSISSKDIATAIENPHIKYFRCLGEYGPLIKNAVRDGNIIDAIEACIASCASFNVGEAVTGRNFFRELYSTDKKCIVDKDGNVYTPTEAVRWLRERKSDE